MLPDNLKDVKKFAKAARKDKPKRSKAYKLTRKLARKQKQLRQEGF